MPRVSVVLPVYNTKEEHLRECIDSILGQTFSDFELLIQNDNSTDERVEQVVLSYTDNRIKYQKNEKNLGISGTRNVLVGRATGQYIAVMDHDDISMPTRFEKQVDFLDAHPEVGIVGTWCETFPNGKVKKKPANSDKIEAALFYSCPILHPSAMMRKGIGIFYDARYSPSEDLALYCSLVGKTKFANLSEVLFHYRVHEENTSKKQSEKMVWASKELRTALRRKFPHLYKRALIDRFKQKLLRLVGIK